KTSRRAAEVKGVAAVHTVGGAVAQRVRSGHGGEIACKLMNVGGGVVPCVDTAQAGKAADGDVRQLYVARVHVVDLIDEAGGETQAGQIPALLIGSIAGDEARQSVARIQEEPWRKCVNVIEGEPFVVAVEIVANAIVVPDILRPLQVGKICPDVELL